MRGWPAQVAREAPPARSVDAQPNVLSRVLAEAAAQQEPDDDVPAVPLLRGADAAHRSWASPPFQLDGGLTTAGYPIASPALQQVDEVGSTGSSPEDSFDSSRSHGKALCEPSPMR